MMGGISDKHDRVCFVTTPPAPRSDSVRENLAPTFEVVDRCQIVTELPSARASHANAGSGLHYAKVVIPFPGAPSVLRGPADRTHLVQRLRDAMSGHDTLKKLHDSCRFHLRIGTDSCTFIVLSAPMEVMSAEWTTATLLQVLQQHRAEQVGLMSQLNSLASTEHPGGRRKRRCENGVDLDGADFAHLPPPLWTAILLQLDLHTQATVKRVCALWQQILSEPRNTEHIIFGCRFCSKGDVQCLIGRDHAALRLLSGSIRSATKSLTIVVGHRHECDISFVCYQLFFALNPRLPLLILRDIHLNFGGLGDEYHFFPMQISFC
ncbi:uncharacterized protein LOC129587941 [Paramacrobiotus metropolitanus]|uniref:uncharacterized protein LOC129587941 n=1 Tax=Paramacrobiotus metropolitanus TaxID=2943436 RepID=UPI0024464520|nr:uncharacterized protein LOC129587941 [Paramacrobiotus metropolitanus]